jgi:hypothetical protein
VPARFTRDIAIHLLGLADYMALTYQTDRVRVRVGAFAVPGTSIAQRCDALVWRRRYVKLILRGCENSRTS